jgi:hypothetical protein
MPVSPTERTRGLVKSPTQRRTAIVALLLAPALTACGFNAQTDQVYQPAVGINDRDDNVYVLNALIVSGEDGSGTFAATLVNTETSGDRLETVSGPGITASRRTVEVPAGGNARLGETGDVTLQGSDIEPGKFVELDLAFQSGQTTTVRVPVVAATGDYAAVPLPDSDSE